MAPQVMIPEGGIAGSELRFKSPDGRWVQALSLPPHELSGGFFGEQSKL